MQKYVDLCLLKNSGVFKTDLFQLYGVENMGVDTKNNFLSYLFQKI